MNSNVKFAVQGALCLGLTIIGFEYDSDVAFVGAVLLFMNILNEF